LLSLVGNIVLPWEGPLQHLFSPLIIRGHQLKNRIFSTGHMTVMLDKDGYPSDRMAAYHQARAAGGAGLVIVEAARVHASGIGSRPAIVAYDDGCIAGYSRIADACHAHDCKVFGQLSHPGRELSEASDGTFAVAHAPSAIPNERFHVMPRQMPITMINEIVAAYGAAAGRMRRAGLDGVEVLASHGYLLSQFLNPAANHRTDQYGGDRDGRLRIVREILAAVRLAVGDDMVVGMRISGDEMEYDGLEADEVLEVAAALDQEELLDYINITAGTSSSLGGSVHIVPPMAVEHGYVAPIAAAIKARLSIPVFVAGRINQPQIAEQVLAGGQADMCGMTRAMIADPRMPTKAQEGRFDDIRACVACNQACIDHMLRGFPISCIQHPETGRELEFSDRGTVAVPRRIVVAGGGPGGMKAAAVAAERGHDVTLYEASSALGGQVKLAQLLPGRAEFGGIIGNLQHEMTLAGVKVVTGRKVDRDLINELAPDALIVATGATPFYPEIEGREDAHVLDGWQVLRGEANVGADVVVTDWRGDWIGMGLAEKLVREGCRVRLAVNGITAGQMIPQYARDKWLGDLHRLGVEVMPYLRLRGADGDTVYLQHTTSGDAVLCEGVDTLVAAHGHQANTGLEDELAGWGGEVHLVGDCLAPRTAEEAVLEGLRAGVAV
jgi:2,4-dienoyl-CoA reductase-like NADH-dependent reductase (Old Yellow Enzyme family)